MAAVAVGAFAAASAAHAGTDVYFSVGVQAPGVYVQPAPVYVQPQPVYVHPRAYVAPQPVYVQPGYGYYGQHRRGPYGDRDGDGIANVYDRDHNYGHGRYARRHGPYGDLDRDGVLNQHDRDRDGDGIRNRYDRAPNDPRFR